MSIEQILSNYGIQNDELERELSRHLVKECRSDANSVCNEIIKDIKSMNSTLYDVQEKIRLVNKVKVVEIIQKHKSDEDFI